MLETHKDDPKGYYLLVFLQYYSFIMIIHT